MDSGTANMAGGNLAGDTLHVGTQISFSSSMPPAVINLSDDATLTAIAATTSFAQQSIVFNASGFDTLNLTINSNYYATMSTQVNIAAYSLLRGTVAVGGHNGELTIHGAKYSFFDNDGPSSVGNNCVATINADVLGIGSFAVSSQSSLAFLHGVGPGQSVSLAGFDALDIGKPHAFLGLVDVENAAPSFNVELAGITNADSYSYANDLLTLFQGGRPIDMLRFLDQGSFQVSENSSGIAISGSANSLPPGSVLLPLHDATHGFS